MLNHFARIAALTSLLVGISSTGQLAAVAQVRVQFPQTTGTQTFPQTPAPPTYGDWQSAVPSTGTPAGQPMVPLQNQGLSGGNLPQTPPFDPYAIQPGAASTAPSLFGTPNYQTVPPTLGAPNPAPFSNPLGASPNAAYPGGYPGAYPNQAPPALFPGGQPSPFGMGGPPLRLIYGPRARYTWLYSDGDPWAVGINDFDFSVAMTLPNFLWSGQPLFVVPSFSLHLWDGPQPMGASTAELPSKAYSAFLDFGWQTDPKQVFSAQVGLRTGIFTDFDTLTSDSLRLMGEGLIRVQVTPKVQIRGGVIYADRLDVKLLPAGGLLWTPNDRVRWDIYFPRPKIAQFISTVGNQDLWWYLGGEFGGGNWTIERSTGLTDRIDMNDFRVSLGLEWGQSALIREGRRTAFIEVGYVFEREVVYDNDRSESFAIEDTLMIRGGIGY